MKTIAYAVAPLCMLCVQCGAAQKPQPASTEAKQHMQPAALIAPRTFRAEPPEGATVNARLNDAQTTSVLEAIVRSQGAQARVAARKAQNSHVAEFAALIMASRSYTEGDLDDFIPMLPGGTQDSDLLRRVRADAQDVTGAMVSLTGSSFDAAYVAGQIREYQHAMTVLDTRLISDARAPMLRRILDEFRSTLIQNLAAARELRAELNRHAAP